MAACTVVIGVQDGAVSVTEAVDSTATVCAEIRSIDGDTVVGGATHLDSTVTVIATPDSSSGTADG